MEDWLRLNLNMEPELIISPLSGRTEDVTSFTVGDRHVRLITTYGSLVTAYQLGQN